ncbi:ABC transporter substrate-binding protein [Devosia rhodophyticola]|uniref:ABC transporter substrate-binding protein n=1 Tax=Devosia rhodophyticola TaxID=3026423 RepID=A0ABY7YZI7_9HYPH|nr:ABC transporter substrate-binding protein [Devosia rhodophyticola]WDR06430.1 ABC transporter substrate-binding protein [Devosia rhodophyticola]
MKHTRNSTFSALSRRVLAGSVAAAALFVGAPMAMAQDVTGEIVIINWFGGSETEMLHKLEADFASKHEGVTFREILPQTSGDQRGGIRQVILGGEQADLLVNTWPAFRQELAESDLIKPVDDIWAANDLDSKLGASWKALSSIGDTNYGVTYTYGDRSGIWYRTDTMTKAGITPPKTWDEFVNGFEKLRAAGITPISVPAKVWAHAEWFESLLISYSWRRNGRQAGPSRNPLDRRCGQDRVPQMG